MVGVLKSEIDERTEPSCVKGTETEYEKQHCKRPNQEVLPIRIVGVENRFLRLLSEREQSEERKEYSHEECDVKMRTGNRYSRLKIKGKEPGYERKRIRQVFDAEESPTHCHNDEREKNAWHFAHLFVNLAQTDAFQHKPEAVIRAPNNEVPARAMP